MRFEDKVVMVTGGASGIGEGIARAFGGEGARVAVCDVDAARGATVAADLAGTGAPALAVTVDVTSTESVEAGVAEVTGSLGPIDVLVNCAGTDVVKPFLDTDEELWDWILDLNLVGVLRCTRAVLPGMVERGRGGRVVNVASDAGRVGNPGESAYSGAKGGVVAFTKTLAREMARHGITANSVCPGPTETPALRRIAEETGSDPSGMVRTIPMRRLGTPADVAAAVAFFASDAAGYVTGQTLSVSGGLTMV
jgi:2-hydroxycyclohexanecarboxyl-CoA dehydrogenase